MQNHYYLLISNFDSIQIHLTIKTQKQNQTHQIKIMSHLPALLFPGHKIHRKSTSSECLNILTDPTGHNSG